jgi:hypothetical protein
MDILGPIFAYLGVMAGIVGALMISFTVAFAPPNEPAPAIVKQTAIIKQTTTAAAKPNVSARSDKLISDKPTIEKSASAVTIVAQSNSAQSISPPVAPKTAAARSKVPTRAEYLRRLVQEERARRWAYQADPDFESRFLGYAD